jgi:hypothetical protein
LWPDVLCKTSTPASTGVLFGHAICNFSKIRSEAEMAILNRALDSIQAHIGFSRARSSGIARNLTEAGFLPRGAPGIAPHLDERDVCTLIAVLAGAPLLREAVDHADAYSKMTPGGAVLSADAPDSIPRSVTDYLEIQAEVALRGGDEACSRVREMKFEFVHEFREMAVMTPGGAVNRFRLIGEDATRPAGHVRTAGVVKGEAFVNLMKDLF